MTDNVSKSVRSRIMQRIRHKDTKPEIAVRSFLFRHGLRYRLHGAKLPGKPDITLPKYKTVIFVHGCFWHQHPGCVHTGVPKSNQAYWKPKLERTVARDLLHRRQLQELGWAVEVVWECEINEARLSELLTSVKNRGTNAG